MPFALVTIGLILIVTGAKDTYKQFGSQVASDFTGEGNFTYWLASLGVVGSLGYIEQFKTFSRVFMSLILIAMVIRNGGVFSKFTEALNEGPEAPAKPAASSTSSTSDNSILNTGISNWTDIFTKSLLPGNYNPAVDIGSSIAQSGAQATEAVAQAQDKARQTTNSRFANVLSTIGGFFFGTPAY